jgi:DamX protein
MMQPPWTTRDKTALQGDSLRRHGLLHQPFQGAADEAFIYGDLALDMPGNALLRHLRTGDQLLLLLGEPGVGKSTQLLRLMSRGSDLLLFCAFKARPGATLTAIERTIRYHWAQAAGAGEATPLPELLRTLCQGEYHPVLAIDDAHLLTPGVLESLLALRRGLRRECDRPPGLLLVGEPLLETLLDGGMEGGTSEPHTAVHLRPLTPEQTEAYLHHRLQAAGARNPDLLSGETARMIHRESGGRPREINARANQRLGISGTRKEAAGGTAPEAAAARRALDAVSTGRPWLIPAFTGLMSILVLLALFNIFRSSGDNGANTADTGSRIEAPLLPEATPRSGMVDSDPQRRLPEVPEASGQTPLPAPQMPSLSERPIAALIPGNAAAPGAADPEAQLGEAPPAARPTEEPGPGDTGVEVPSASASRDTGPDAIEPDPEPAADAEPDPASPTETAGDPPSPPAETAGDPPSPPPDAARDPAAPAQVPPAQSPSAASRNQPRETRPPASSQAPSAVAAAKLQDATWVRARAPDRYTIQIAAGRDLQALHRSARGLPPEVERAWFTSQRDGRNWYTLIVGDHADQERARRAVNQLPAQMRRNQPWIRSFGSIHETMD